MIDSVWLRLDEDRKNCFQWRLVFQKQFRKFWRLSTVLFFLKTSQTAAFCGKVSQISNFITFQRRNKFFLKWKWIAKDSSCEYLSKAIIFSIFRFLTRVFNFSINLTSRKHWNILKGGPRAGKGKRDGEVQRCARHISESGLRSAATPPQLLHLRSVGLAHSFNNFYVRSGWKWGKAVFISHICDTSSMIMSFYIKIRVSRCDMFPC